MTEDEIAAVLAEAEAASEAHREDDTGDIELLLDERDAWQDAAHTLAAALRTINQLSPEGDSTPGRSTT